MYLAYFGFREPPFSVTPNPRLLYSNPGYEEAFANLRYGIEGRKGFTVLTGEVGTGKTTLLRRLMATLHSKTPFVFLFNTRLGFDEILAFICDELRITPVPSLRVQRIQALNEFLLRQVREGRTTALLVDEAQNLGDDVLEELRLLSNLETNDEKLLQIALVGQPELDAKLARQELRQLRQRIAVRCHLERLKASEIEPFIDARLAAVGYGGPQLFSPDALLAIARFSRGVPRLINIVCDNALLIAFAASKRSVTEAMVAEAAADLDLVPASAAGGFTPVALDHAFRDVEEELRERYESQPQPRAPKPVSATFRAARAASRATRAKFDGPSLRQSSAVVLLLGVAAGSALVARKQLDPSTVWAALSRSQQQVEPADDVAAPANDVVLPSDDVAASSKDGAPLLSDVAARGAALIGASAAPIRAEERPSSPTPSMPSSDRVVAPRREPPRAESIGAPRREERRARPRRRAKRAEKPRIEPVALVVWSEVDEQRPPSKEPSVRRILPRRNDEWRCGAADSAEITTFSNPGFSTGELGW